MSPKLVLGYPTTRVGCQIALAHSPTRSMHKEGLVAWGSSSGKQSKQAMSKGNMDGEKTGCGHHPASRPQRGGAQGYRFRKPTQDLVTLDYTPCFDLSKKLHHQ